MDKRTVKLKAEERKRREELLEKRKQETDKLNRDILKVADFFKHFINDKRYAEFSKLLRQRQQTLIYQLIWLEETEPFKNAIASERLRAQIQTIERILTVPDDFLKAKEELVKKSPELLKEEEESE